MRWITIIRITVVVLLFGAIGFSTPAQDQSNQGSDDVAAAARKAREQQKNAQKPAKVVTNDDIPAATPTSPAGNTSDAKADGQKAAAADDKDSDNDPKSEAYWRKRFQAIHDKIDTAQKELDILQRELDKDQVQYYSDPQKALMQQHDRSDINDRTAKIDAKKKEIDGLNQQLSDLEDDLRKSGGDPGWAR
jgi:predicted RNase H-like nuclease (RuvC/YqgF family)